VADVRWDEAMMWLVHSWLGVSWASKCRWWVV
jgi:hypothetical protein